MTKKRHVRAFCQSAATAPHTVVSMDRGRLTRWWCGLTVAAMLLTSSGCGFFAVDDDPHRTEPLRNFRGGEAKAIHVADYNGRSGPATKTVRIPVDAPEMLIRFDCVGDGEEFTLRVKGFDIASGGGRCDHLGGVVYSLGSGNTQGQPVVRRGEALQIRVRVDPEVRWSLSIDLAPDHETTQRLVDVDS